MGSIKYYRGTQADFDRIIDKKNFAKVKEVYLCEDGGIYFVVEDKKKKRKKNLLDFWKKKGD